MIQFPAGAKIWRALGRTDMRRGMDGLALQVQETLKQDPHSGHLFVFRGKRGDLLKALWYDGQGACLFSNWTFAGSDRGGDRTAAIYTLLQTAKLNDVDPQA